MAVGSPVRSCSGHILWIGSKRAVERRRSDESVKGQEGIKDSESSWVSITINSSPRKEGEGQTEKKKIEVRTKKKKKKNYGQAVKDEMGMAREDRVPDRQGGA